MWRPRAVASAAALFLLPLVWQGAATSGQVTLDATDKQKLRHGDALVHVTQGATATSGRIAAVIDIPVAPLQLWATMVDCGQAAKFVTGLKRCRVLRQGADGTWDIREHIIQWIWLMPSTRSVFRSDYTPHRRIRFQRTGGDLKTLHGEWRLKPLQGGRTTRLTYTATIDPGIALPGAIVRAAIRSDVPATLKAIRHEAVAANGRR